MIWKIGFVPIEEDDDVEFMFGVMVSKGMPFFVEIYMEKVSNDGNLLISSSLGETSSGRDSGGSWFRHEHEVVDSLTSIDTSNCMSSGRYSGGSWSLSNILTVETIHSVAFIG